LACALRKQQPARTAAQIDRIIMETECSSPSARTIQRHFVAAGLPWKGGQIGRALGRFEAEFRNELWTGDALHGPLIDGRRTYLFCFLDDSQPPAGRVPVGGAGGRAQRFQGVAGGDRRARPS
jgi:putative transposase